MLRSYTWTRLRHNWKSPEHSLGTVNLKTEIFMALNQPWDISTAAECDSWLSPLGADMHNCYQDLWPDP